MPRSFTPRTCDMTSTIACAFFSFSSRSLPNTLTEFSPFTPETASSTLSLIICEKLKTTPGKAACSSADSSSVSLSLVRPRGHSSKGASGAKSSMFWKPATSVPSSGRPSCETTVSTSLCFRVASSHGPLASWGQPRRMRAHPPDVLRRLLQRDRHRQRRADPEVALLEVRHELAAEEPEREHADEDGDHARWPATSVGRRSATSKSGM